jgi:replication initiation and membrane attachment protein DnaB
MSFIYTVLSELSIEEWWYNSHYLKLMNRQEREAIEELINNIGNVMLVFLTLKKDSVFTIVIIRPLNFSNGSAHPEYALYLIGLYESLISASCLTTQNS